MLRKFIEPKDPLQSDSCADRILRYGGYGAMVGAFGGAVIASFSEDEVRRVYSKIGPWRYTARITGRGGLLIGTLSGMFAAGQCISESVVHPDSIVNGIVGSAMAGVGWTLVMKQPFIGLGVGILASCTCIAWDVTGGLQAVSEVQRQHEEVKRKCLPEYYRKLDEQRARMKEESH